MERSGENYRFQAQRTHSRSASWSLQRNHNANDVTSGFAQRLGPIRNALAFAGLGRLTPPERSASPDATATDVAEDMPTSAPVTTTRAHQRGASGNVFFASPSPSYASNASTFNLETGIQIDATGSGERAETQARNNGRHGNNNNNNANDDDNSNSAEFQVAMRWLQRIVPFALLFGVKLLWDHGLGVLVLVGLFVMFVNANKQIKRQVALQDRRNRHEIFRTMVFLSSNVVLIYYVFPSHNLYRCLIFRMPNLELDDAWDIMWSVGITDFVIRFLAMVLKCLVLLACNQCIMNKKKIAQFYRLLLPFPLWLNFFSMYNDLSSAVSALFFTGLYTLLKGLSLYEKCKDVKKAIIDFCHDRQYGVRPTKEELASAEASCPICQDALAEPILLHCRHIFCEGCISVWFDRERTCPLCRAAVAHDPLWRDGNTSASIQLF
ncbi:E3 ubiquitin-protein ligase RNFT1-like isoform X2 [Oscarella lobularis]|uniref:E3 ubiquitin-protein ligase RNFT1-like isoform X2 n=1 Tax=Oscarella lobularis TaxID=121494 RepID=UPI0033143439